MKFVSRKCRCKCCLQNVCYFVEASNVLNMVTPLLCYPAWVSAQICKECVSDSGPNYGKYANRISKKIICGRLYWLFKIICDFSFYLQFVCNFLIKGQHFGPCIKLPELCRCHFQSNFAEWKWLIFFNLDKFKFLLEGLFGHKSLFVQVMAWLWTSNKPLSDPVMSKSALPFGNTSGHFY